MVSMSSASRVNRKDDIDENPRDGHGSNGGLGSGGGGHGNRRWPNYKFVFDHNPASNSAHAALAALLEERSVLERRNLTAAISGLKSGHDATVETDTVPILEPLRPRWRQPQNGFEGALATSAAPHALATVPQLKKATGKFQFVKHIGGGSFGEIYRKEKSKAPKGFVDIIDIIFIHIHFFI